MPSSSLRTPDHPPPPSSILPTPPPSHEQAISSYETLCLTIRAQVRSHLLHVCFSLPRSGNTLSHLNLSYWPCYRQQQKAYQMFHIMLEATRLCICCTHHLCWCMSQLTGRIICLCNILSPTWDFVTLDPSVLQNQHL